ncbi:MAG: SMC-Scp complex subunit ScpB [Verrucomicrobiota bacterium]
MELKDILEAILFTSQKPLTPQELRDLLRTTAEQAEEPAPAAFKRTPLDNIQAALEQLQREHEDAKRTFRLACVAGAWQFVSLPEFAPWLRTLLGQKTRPPRLSQPGLETLAIIAYRQPVTRAEIEQVRGVAVDGVMQTLLERGLVEQTGRAEVVGRPSLYGTTPAFLEYFGLRGLTELPAADELRRIPVQKPESLLTADLNLATAPASQPAAETTEASQSPHQEAAPSATNEAIPAAPPAEPQQT